MTRRQCAGVGTKCKTDESGVKDGWSSSDTRQIAGEGTDEESKSWGKCEADDAIVHHTRMLNTNMASTRRKTSDEEHPEFHKCINSNEMTKRIPTSNALTTATR